MYIIYKNKKGVCMPVNMYYFVLFLCKDVNVEIEESTQPQLTDQGPVSQRYTIYMRPGVQGLCGIR